MTRIDRLVTARIASRILAVVAIFLGLIGLVESLDAWRYSYLSSNQGTRFAVLAIFVSAATWSMKVLPVTVLIGSIIALLDLQSHRELMVMKASGISVWRILRGPIVLIFIASIGVSVGLDTLVTQINRTILPVPRLDNAGIGGQNAVWLEQDNETGHFIVQGDRNSRDAHILDNATFYLPPGQDISQVQAGRAILNFRNWTLEDVTLIASNQFPQKLPTYEIATTSSRADLSLRMTNSGELTFFELGAALATGLSDPLSRAAAAMRFAKLLALPALLVGSLLIAFAFTAGYRRQGSYGPTIMYGIILGFVVFVVTEMADRAGSAGVLDPAFAAWGPAVVAIVIGLTILLHKEDGRA